MAYTVFYVMNGLHGVLCDEWLTWRFLAFTGRCKVNGLTVFYVNGLHSIFFAFSGCPAKRAGP
jgi:hypothetical protein